MLILRIIVFALSFLCIVFNINPFLTTGEINIGLITGIAAGILFFVYGLFFKSFNGFVASMWKHTAGKITLTSVAVILVFCLLTGGITFSKIIAKSRPSEHKTEYVIVLGCRVYSDKPGIFLTKRINAAYNYLTESPDSKAILSGGQGEGEDISEAQCMFNTLVEKGIDPARLIKEDKSESTFQNFSKSVELMKQNGLNLEEITVITNDYHEYRASKFAEKCGLKAYSYPAKTPWDGYLPFAMREVYAVIFQIYLTK
ncbi:MAG: YdcF family protein [Clostridia bacterium]|nr:YdcF family protein [Clostridia bacterium]